MHSCDAWIGLNLHGLKVYLFLDDREVILERDAKELTAFMLAVQCINTHFCSNLARPATHMKYPDLHGCWYQHFRPRFDGAFPLLVT